MGESELTGALRVVNCYTTEEFTPVVLFERVVPSRPVSRFVNFGFSLLSLQSINVEIRSNVKANK